MSQEFFSFEQAILDAEQADRDARAAAKAAALAAREAEKQKEEQEKSSRRRMRASEYERRHTVDWAVCGIRCYNRNAYSKQGWTHCHKCGAALRYFESLNDAQADAKTRECKRP
jgi:hypothetical protein